MTYMYALRATTGGPIKIGRATDPAVRLAQIQPNSPVVLELLGHVEETFDLSEASEHRRLGARRLHGEWFDITPVDLPWLAQMSRPLPAATAPDYTRPKALWTHCKRGHEYTPENTYQHPDGRQCRACRRSRKVQTA